MKLEELIVGRWYRAYKSQSYYIKFKETENNYQIICSEYIEISNNNKHYNCGGNCGTLEELTDVNIENIIKFLPENHPDIIEYNNSLISQDYTYIITLLTKYHIK